MTHGFYTIMHISPALTRFGFPRSDSPTPNHCSFHEIEEVIEDMLDKYWVLGGGGQAMVSAAIMLLDCQLVTERFQKIEGRPFDVREIRRLDNENANALASAIAVETGYPAIMRKPPPRFGG